MKAKKRFFLIAMPVLMAVALSACDGFFDNCTQQMETISVVLKHPDGQPVLLDNYKVFWVGGGRYLDLEHRQWDRSMGRYLIAYSGMTRDFRGRQRELRLRFTGYLDGEVVHTQYIRVGVDRCEHVYLVSTESLVQTIYGISDEIRKSRFCEFVNTENINGIIPTIVAFAGALEDFNLQMIADWLLLHGCIKDAYVDDYGGIIFSFFENGGFIKAQLGFGFDNFGLFASISLVE